MAFPGKNPYKIVYGCDVGHLQVEDSTTPTDARKMLVERYTHLDSTKQHLVAAQLHTKVQDDKNRIEKEYQVGD
jgi:hypothetical protein